MTENRSLVVFIDGFPSSWLERTGLDSALPYSSDLVPNIGYSLNIKAELFAGLNPDAWGIFNEFSPTWCGPARSVHVVRLPYLVDRLSHRFLEVLTRRRLGNIPFGLLSHFEPLGANAYERDFAPSSILDELPFDRILYSEVGHDNVLTMLKRASAERNLFVAIGHLDSLLHTHGTEDPAPLDYAHNCAEVVASVVPRFDRTILVSDHGHSNVVRSSDTSSAWRDIGRCGPFFVDGTTARFWRAHNSPLADWRTALHDFGELAIGRFLTSDERRVSGIARDRFGDEIFVLEEGHFFSPNFFGRGAPVSMHGYWPASAAHSGVLASTDPIVGNRSEVNPMEAYELLSDTLHGSA